MSDRLTERRWTPSSATPTVGLERLRLGLEAHPTNGLIHFRFMLLELRLATLLRSCIPVLLRRSYFVSVFNRLTYGCQVDVGDLLNGSAVEEDSVAED